MNIGELRPALQKLVASPHKVSVRSLWAVLDPEERQTSLLVLLASPDGDPLLLQGAVAARRNFRVNTVQTWPVEKLVAEALKVELPVSIQAAAIFELLMAAENTAMPPLMEALGLIGDDGPKNVEVLTFSPDRVAAAVDALTDDYAPTDILFCLLFLKLSRPALAESVDSWLRTLEKPNDALTQQPAFEIASPISSPDPRTVRVDGLGFTTLDSRLILSIIDCVGDIAGAPSRDEIDDMLLELEQLNGRRHTTFHHVGFRDALFGRPAAQALAAENTDRLRWYWAGYITGVARTRDWARIRELFDSAATVRSLAQTRDGAAKAAAWIVFQALAEGERYGEAAGFPTVAAIEISEELRDAMLSVGVDLVRTNRAADARAILDLLWAAKKTGNTEQDEADADFFTELRRRRALCLRQLGEVSPAMELLRDLENHPSPFIQAIARTDIGLVRSGIRRLGELTLPHEKSEVGPFIDNLQNGEGDFASAISISKGQSAHASFALGVLDLARGNFRHRFF